MRLHLIDGTYELFRAHYSKRPDHKSPSGMNLKATVGVVSSLLALLHDEAEAVTHVAVAFDNPIRSFRNDLFSDYKSDEGVPRELHAQFDAVENAVRALGIVVWSMNQYEADDGLASGAAQFRDTVEQVRILSPDKDLRQCLQGTRIVQVDRQRKKIIDESMLRADRGFGPASVPDFLALTGDSADGIPGLPGFGEKTASSLLSAYGHLENIPAHPEEWTTHLRGAVQLAATLSERRADALLYRQLATLITTVPLCESLNDLQYRGVPRLAFEAWCHEVGAQTLKARPKRFQSAA